MNKNNEIHVLERKHHKMYRLLTSNEIKDWVNKFYILKNKCEEENTWWDNEWRNLTVFCIDAFGQCKYLRELICELEFDELKHHARLYCKFIGGNDKDYRNREIKYFYFLTATGGQQKILVNEKNISNMLELNKKIFSNEIYNRFYRVYWNIETGKKEDDPNLHTHALIIFHSTNKNFDRDYRGCFKKVFGNIDLQIQKFGWRGNQEIYHDKLGYLKNINKSILHKNYKDLEIFEHLE